MKHGRAAGPSRSGEQSDLRLGDRRREGRRTRPSPRPPHVVKLDIVNNRLVPNAIEPRAAIGHYDKAEDHYTCWTTSQNPHVARLVMSAFYNVAPENKLRVIAPDVGGGFGSKIYIYPEEITCLWASKKTGVPVKWTADRSESFLTDAHARDHVTTAEMALRRRPQDHRPARRHDRQSRRLHVALLVRDADLSLRHASVGPVRDPGDLRQCEGGLHATPARSMPIAAQAGPRRPCGRARWWKRPRASSASRRPNCGGRTSSSRSRYQTPVIMNYDSGDFDALLDAATKAIDYDGFASARAEAKSAGKLRGIGMSCYIEACGIAPSAAVGSLGAGVGLWESAEVRVNAVGTIEVLTGSHSHGQGHETTFAQLVVDRFGVPIDTVSIVHGDTDKVQMGMGTYGSRSGPVGMSAIVKALDKVEAKAKKIAAHLLEADEGDIVIENGECKVAGTDKSVPWFQVALAAYTAHNLPAGMEPGLKEGAFYDPTNFTFPSGCYICEVEVDPETGKTEIVQFVAADDFGNIINPMIVEGQVHGGLAQGIGQALLEGRDLRPQAGQLMTGSYMDYTHAARRRPAVLQGPDDRDAVPGQSARHQGLRRGRRDRLAAGGHQRDHRCDRQQRPDHAGHAAEGLGGAEGRDKALTAQEKDAAQARQGA